MKPSKVKFISEKSERLFNQLNENDPIKKPIKRAINDLKKNAFLESKYQKKFFQKNI